MKDRLARIAAMLSIAFALVSCSPASSISPDIKGAPQQTVRFLVTNQGHPLANASIEVARPAVLDGYELDRFSVTGSAGTSEFPLTARHAYVAMLRSADNSAMARVEFTLPSRERDETTAIVVPAALQPAVTVRGRIMVPGATSHDGPQVSVNLFAYGLGTSTATDGSYDLPMPPGRWYLKIVRDGYAGTKIPVDGPP